MKRLLGVAALLGLLAVGAFAGIASAQCISPIMIKFDNDAFAFESLYNNATYASAPGSQLTVVARISCFGPPLDFLNANMPATEYTMVWTANSAGTVHTNPIAGVDYYDTDYQGGVFAIYEDVSPDAPTALTLGGFGAPPNAAVPSLFADGTDILHGTIDYLHTHITKNSLNSWSGSFNALYTSTGGSKYSLIGNAQSNLNGLWCSLGGGSGQCTLPGGYSAHPSGKFDQPSSTATSSATWGRLKLLYR